MSAGQDIQAGTVKCLVWDLDRTLWDGVLLEGDGVGPRPGVVETLRTLDGRGILHSVASRNEPAIAQAKLEEMGLWAYFVYPRIGWQSKADSVRRIAESLNIGIDAVAFIDDDPAERAEVRFSLPAVRCFDAAEAAGLAQRPEFQPTQVTGEARRRREMVQADARRQTVAERFEGTREGFLATLGMTFTIATAGQDDLQRAEELTVRTNQLNATGYTYSLQELEAFRQSDRHLLLVTRLEDRFGSYGTIGLALVDREADVWTIKLLLMSCRVMSRGVGTILLNHIMGLAREAGVRLQAEFVPTDRNRMMLVTYRFAGFRPVRTNGEVQVMENDLGRIQPCPDYVRLRVAP